MKKPAGKVPVDYFDIEKKQFNEDYKKINDQDIRDIK